MERSLVSDFENSLTNREQSSAQRAGLISTYNFLERYNVTYRKTELFQFYNIAPRTAYRLLAKDAYQKLHNDPKRKETRGRKRLISPEKIKEIDAFLHQNGVGGRELTWLQLAEQVGVDVDNVSMQTLRHMMGNTLKYSSCITCPKAWISPSIAEDRVRFAMNMLEKYPSEDEWKRIRFSGEVYYGLGRQGKARTIRKHAERYCGDCLKESNLPSNTDPIRKRIHAWAAIGYNFKSEIQFYTTNATNGKRTQKDYIEKILEPCVQPWLRRGDDFVLEEDNDISHGPANNNNIVRKWKQEKGLVSYFNCAGSPDLAIVEPALRHTTAHIHSQARWDDDVLREFVSETWQGISQEWINQRVLALPVRLLEVIARHGQLCTIVSY